MVFQLATRYPKHIATFFLALFSGTFYPVYALHHIESKPPLENVVKRKSTSWPSTNGNIISGQPVQQKKAVTATKELASTMDRTQLKREAIGGPTQPEMASFKSVGAGNMVNLFTGDFSYNIPLLDVGGYPVNIFYDGGVSMEQEASWVGLGWNINPGTVSRNMRGLPDDFNGEDTMTQTQQMKTNTTWGASLGADLELIGIKSFKNFTGSIGLSLGMSFNNYLGPALELGIKGGTNFRLADKAGPEKVLGLGGGLAANISSRNGLTLSPNFSLSANAHLTNATLSNGVRLGTSYNSRTGIKQLQISEQMSYNYQVGKRSASIGQSLFGTSISFAKPSYIPAIRVPVTNEAWSGHFQLGMGMFGTYGSMEAEVYRQRSEIALDDRLQKKPMVGYLYYQKASNNPSAVMDFTRVNDNEVTPNTPILSAPQYTYDVFTLQGEGTGGSIRAYRNDRGFVRDNITRSKDKNLSIGADVGIPGHYGANFNLIKTPSSISGWGNGNRLRNTTGFVGASGLNENVYFRNPGESSVLATDQFAGVGGTELVRFKLGGTNAAPTLEPVLERFSKENKAVGTTNLLATAPSTERKKRSQVVSFLTAEEASWVGLDTLIRTYDVDSVLNYANNLKFDTLSRTGYYRKKHHLSEITVTEIDGKRYVYGIPVYNVTQKDFTFSVAQPGDDVDQVPTSSSEVSQLSTQTGKDGFLQTTEMPAYAHSFLLTGLLSPDYVDVNGDGITEDDLGQAVKFNYTRIRKPGGWGDYEWRTPATKTSTLTANFNPGHLTEAKDDKGLLTYGKRESWYLHSIESKTMVALFTVENRKDGKGVAGEMGGINVNDNSQKRLKKIDLYSKADLKKNGLVTAKPIKTVWFTYSYDLCPGVPGNNEAIETEEGGTANLNAPKGKLTLTGIYFTYNGKTRTNKSQYRFFYTDKNGSGNPSYQAAASDRWGTYKPATQNPVIGQNPTKTLRNSLYPYATQTKSVADQNAGAWALKSVLLPSGGQLDVQYESDDYAFIQNRRASTMMGIAGLGNTSVLSNSNKLFTTKGLSKLENDYVFINVQDICKTDDEVKEKYLKGQDQLAFKLSVNMPKGIEYVPVYGIVEASGFVPNVPIIWVRLKRVNGYSPLTIAVLDFLRERLPGQAFSGYDVSESSGLQQVGELLNGMLVALGSAFQDPIKYLRDENKVQTVNLNASFVRLNDPDGYKFGGGHRVRSVTLRDNWEPMTKLGDASGQATAVYGQQYDYTTTEIFNGKERTISSGVASYEPSIGGEENPFQTMVQVVDQLPLGPASYGAIEMPVLDAFFPAPVVGYSKVTVRSLQKVPADQTKKSRSGIGKQVTEFYTAKDFPVYYNHTSLEPASDKQEHQASLLSFFYKFAFDSRAVSQGFLVETNDMHGKMKSQASYAEGDEKTPINFTQNFYRNTGSKGLAETFDFVHAAKGGTIEPGTMGVDVELMTDTREFSVKSSSLEIQGQVDWLTIIPPFWLPTIWPVVGNSENTYRAVTTTKVITYHSVLDSVVVIDKGSQVSTKNLVYDAETGAVIVNRTINEFDLPVYTTMYPAWWAYEGTGLAYKNIGALYKGVSFFDGKMTGNPAPASTFESGDELLLLNDGSLPSNCEKQIAATGTIKKIWAFDRNKGNGLPNTTPDFVFMDRKGQLFTKTGVDFRIVRSGKRNLLNQTVASVTTMTSPIVTSGVTKKLVIDGTAAVLTATALELKESWKTDNDIIKRIKKVFNATTCKEEEVVDCAAGYESAINPYTKGLLGTYRQDRSLVFYGERSEKDPSPAIKTNLPKNGFLKDFKLYWDFSTSNKLIADGASTKWVWNSQVTRMNAKGLETETKDALNIYTSAQYGFEKSLPIAITNNAKSSEAFAEGFEDSDYKETINGLIPYSCTQKHIDFQNMATANSQIVNTKQLGFPAHTGNYALKVLSTSEASKIVTLVPESTTESSYDLNFTPGTIGSLYESGVFDVSMPFYTNSATQNTQPLHYEFPQTTGFQLMVRPYINVTPSGTNPTYYNGELHYQITASQYYDIKETGTYNLNLLIGYNVMHINGMDMTVIIRDPTGNVTQRSAVLYASGDYQKGWTESLCMTKGIYKVDFIITEHLSQHCSPTYGNSCITANGDVLLADRNYVFTISKGTTTQTQFQGYRSMAMTTECTYTKPIPGTGAMLNPIFSVPQNKKMLLSAWVKDNSNAIANGASTTSEINLDFGTGSPQTTLLKPEGPVIDGWQRYEGSFTAPATANQVTIKFKNNTGGAIYFDDVRIHPFNANMKSYVYDPVSLRLSAELDANNYATFYEYDEEGTLVRTKAETKDGIKTIKETRSFQQREIKQPY